MALLRVCGAGEREQVVCAAAEFTHIDGRGELLKLFLGKEI